METKKTIFVEKGNYEKDGKTFNRYFVRGTVRGVRRLPVFTVSQLDEPIADAADAYLRLHLMSMRLAKPNTLNLDGIFGKLATVVWTNYGPFATETFAIGVNMPAKSVCFSGLAKNDGITARYFLSSE